MMNRTVAMLASAAIALGGFGLVAASASPASATPTATVSSPSYNHADALMDWVFSIDWKNPQQVREAVAPLGVKKDRLKNLTEASFKGFSNNDRGELQARFDLEIGSDETKYFDLIVTVDRSGKTAAKIAIHTNGFMQMHAKPNLTFAQAAEIRDRHILDNFAEATDVRDPSYGVLKLGPFDEDPTYQVYFTNDGKDYQLAINGLDYRVVVTEIGTR